MKKLYTSKPFLKMAGGRMHTSHLNSLDPSLAKSYKNHQKILTYFSHFAPLVLFFLTEKQSQKKGGGHGTMSPPPLNTLLPKTIGLEAETSHLC